MQLGTREKVIRVVAVIVMAIGIFAIVLMPIWSGSLAYTAVGSALILLGILLVVFTRRPPKTMNPPERDD